MLISLSLSTTITSRPESPALLSPSYARPHDSEPSPITAATLKVSPRRSRPAAMPSAAEMLVAAWPAPNASYALSERFRKPLTPSSWRSVSMPVLRPVSSLCG
jgi:hypothetical protein